MDKFIYGFDIAVVVCGFLQAIISDNPSIQIRGIAKMIMGLWVLETYLSR